MVRRGADWQKVGDNARKNASYSRFIVFDDSNDPLEVGHRVNSKHRKNLAEAMRFYRKELKMTQEKLGELADLNPKYIGEVERCEKTISVDSLARIAEALKVDLTVFFKPAPE